ncbi:hypothetical protein BDP55DRAFT_673056 [Colletotrichum godetiae]|uniref:Secreted protein n=1 Tax=Colletotrichum godetiae TaxID=1209918 RepID=A0AAJ0AEH4_9PEZI|nr:uncharacterized protein BDP55DRAFT_673056 [Colletotrichum godetiae]KAK1672408.1 hypothetical protein BDP55DRAFT_673056 [Colletotrichum godetiae]
MHLIIIGATMAAILCRGTVIVAPTPGTFQSFCISGAGDNPAIRNYSVQNSPAGRGLCRVPILRQVPIASVLSPVVRYRQINTVLGMRPPLG